MTNPPCDGLPPQPAKVIKLPTASPASIELIGFLTTDGRDLWIDEPSDIKAIMEFIRANGIVIRQD